MDLIFIDGGHSYETVTSDWQYVQMLMKEGTTVVFDDFVNVNARVRAGIGVNCVINEIDRDVFSVQLLTPIDWYFHPWGMMTVRLVKVTIKAA